MSRASTMVLGSALPISPTAPNSVGSDDIERAKALLRSLGAVLAPAESVKRQIEIASRRAGLTYWRGFDLWYGKARRVESTEVDGIDAALAAQQRRSARDELNELRLRIARLEARLDAGDAEFHRPAIDVLGAADAAGRHSPDGCRGLDRPAGAGRGR